jgi:hypothetical protein
MKVIQRLGDVQGKNLLENLNKIFKPDRTKPLKKGLTRLINRVTGGLVLYDLTTQGSPFLSFVLDQFGCFGVVSESENIEHKDFKTVDNIWRKDIAIDFHRYDRILLISCPWGN